jgi:hypothetical protein
LPVRLPSLVYRRAILPFFLSLISLRQKPYRAAIARRELPVAALALAGFLPERTAGVATANTTPVPMIRGDNPPLSKLAEIEKFENQNNIFNGLEYASMLIILILGIFAAFSVAPFMILVFGLAGLLWCLFNARRKELIKRAEIVSQPIILNSYNVEFTTALAGYESLIHTTVHFQAPSDFKYLEQLNRVTENLLIHFSLSCKEPPQQEAVAQYLRQSLVQFQNENNLSVLRLNVPLLFPVAPDRPTGINV